MAAGCLIAVLRLTLWWRSSTFLADAHLRFHHNRSSIPCLQHRLIEADALVEERRRELREAEHAAEEVARALEVARSV